MFYRITSDFPAENAKFYYVRALPLLRTASECARGTLAARSLPNNTTGAGKLLSYLWPARLQRGRQLVVRSAGIYRAKAVGNKVFYCVAANLLIEHIALKVLEFYVLFMHIV